MWRSLRVDLRAGKAYWQEVPPEEVAMGGRYRTARLLLEQEAYRFDPFSPENPLVFAVEPLAGTGFPTPTAPAWAPAAP